MRRSVTLVVITFFMVNLAYAELIDGYYINLKNDTIRIKMQIPLNIFHTIPLYQKLQKKIVYYDSLGKKLILKPKQAIEVNFNFNNQRVRMISLIYSFPNIGHGGYPINSFIKIIIDGNLKLFANYVREYSPSGSQILEIFLLQKGTGDFFRTDWIFFKKTMSEYFSNCPVLQQKIIDKTFKANDILQIVQFYNANCGM